MSDFIEYAELFRELPEPDERRRLRKACGLALVDIANELGVTRAAVLYWEKGRTPGSKEMIAAYLGVLNKLAHIDANRSKVTSGPATRHVYRQGRGGSSPIEANRSNGA